MKFCGNCGTPLEDTQKLCANCGQELINDTQNDLAITCYDENTSLTTKESNQLDIDIQESEEYISVDDFKEIPNKDPKKKHLIVISAVILLICIGLGIYLNISKNSKTASYMLTKFEDYVNKNDATALSKIITTVDSDKTLSEFEVSNFIEYLSKNQDEFNSLLTTLQREATHYDNTEYDASYSNKTSMAYISMINEAYTVVINTSSVSITFPSTNVNDYFLECIKFYINDTEYAAEKVNAGTYRIENLIPAEYTIEGRLENEFISIQDSESIDVFKNRSASSSAYKIALFENQFNSVKLRTNAELAKLYINGKEVQSFTDNSYFAPITEDMKLCAALTISDEEIKTKEVTRDGSSSITLNFDNNVLKDLSFADDGTKDAMTELLNSYLENLASAVSFKSYDFISPHIYPNSSLATKQKSYIKGLKKANIDQKFVSCDITDISVSDDKKEIIVTVNEIFDITTDKNKVTTPATNKYRITYHSKQKKYLISDIVKDVQ